MFGSEAWVVLRTGAACALIAVVVARILADRGHEPEDVTIGFLGPSLAALYLLILAVSLASEWQTIGDASQAACTGRRRSGRRCTGRRRSGRPAPPPAHRPAALVPPPVRHRRPRSHPSSSVFHARPERPVAASVRAPKPVLPVGILLIVVLTPCVAVAATRFGRRAR
ncbi:MAG TPA: hypothetical protein VGL63_07340 [Streptosporangiaceae bacterium]